MHYYILKMHYLICIIFRAIFDLSNKIALLILLRMFALYVKKKQSFEQKFKNWLKRDILAQFRLAQLDAAWLSSTQLNSA